LGWDAMDAMLEITKLEDYLGYKCSKFILSVEFEIYEGYGITSSD
jgi:hypothetical protein